jgi:hypothetical protein
VAMAPALGIPLKTGYFFGYPQAACGGWRHEVKEVPLGPPVGSICSGLEKCRVRLEISQGRQVSLSLDLRCEETRTKATCGTKGQKPEVREEGKSTAGRCPQGVELRVRMVTMAASLWAIFPNILLSAPTCL